MAMAMTMAARKRKHHALMTALLKEIEAGLDRDVAVQRGAEIFEECFGDLPPLKRSKPNDRS